MKIVIDYEPSLSPNNDDILVWDTYDGKFKQVSKSSFLNATNEEIKSLKATTQKQKIEIDELKSQVKTLAKTLLGDL
jgi:cell shape-determining protein MreC